MIPDLLLRLEQLRKAAIYWEGINPIVSVYLTLRANELWDEILRDKPEFDMRTAPPAPETGGRK